MTTAITVSIGVGHRSSIERAIFAAASATALLAALATGQPAYAQIATGIQAAKQTTQEAGLEEIMVTGTRIVRDGYQSPTPVTVMTAEDIARDAPTSMTDFVLQIPQFANSTTSRNGAANLDGSGGATNLSLRGLGANRTLVLLDGVRVVPASVFGFFGNGGSVDIATFPDQLVSRVDVVTGGASAAYGSDALAGVVNFILDKDFTGVKGNLTGGVTGYGDDQQYLVSLTAGTKFAGDRGHFVLSGSANYNAGILDPGNSRSWISDNLTAIQTPGYTPTNGLPYYTIYPHGGSSVYVQGGLINSGPLKGTAFGPGGTPFQFIYGHTNDGANMAGGDSQLSAGAADYQQGPDTSLDTQLDRQNLFTRANYDVTDNARVYLQAMYSHLTDLSYYAYPLESVSVQSGNPFIPASVQARMNALGVTSFPLGIEFSQSPRLGSFNEKNFLLYTIGSDGKFDAFQTGWSWNAYLSRSTYSLRANTLNDVNQVNWGLATDVVTSPTSGLPVCRSTLSNPNNGCVPLNPMGTGVANQAALGYILGTAHLDQILAQNDASVSVNGEPFSTWAGPVSVAFGAEHRSDSVSGKTDALDNASVFYCCGFKATNGSYNVNEGFIETVIPLAKDQFWAKSLELNGAVRETDYSVSGAVTTWKVGVTYAPIDDIRFRTTRSRDIRAPNLGELFQAGHSTTGLDSNPFHDGRLENITKTIRGNTNLKPEVADTTTAGVVVQPSFLPGFSASVDYYAIDIKDVIDEIAPPEILTLCYQGNQALCNQIQFGPGGEAAGNIVNINQVPANLATQRTRGLDIDATYTRHLSDIAPSWNGTVRFRGLATRVLQLDTISPNGTVLNGVGVLSGLLGEVDEAALESPKFRYKFTAEYDINDYSVSWTGRGFSSGVQSSLWTQCTSSCPTLTAPNYSINNNHMPGPFYQDVSFTYHLKTASSHAAALTFVVENIANWEPHVAQIYYDFGTYDTLGRVFRANFSFKL